MLRFVVVGAGPAGHNAALEIRRQYTDAHVVLLGREDCLPYERPDVSKAMLISTDRDDPKALPGASDYRSLGIDYRPQTEVLSIDRTAKTIDIGSGASTPYDRLLLATGSRSRKLPGKDLPVHYLRTAQDARRLRPLLRPATHVLIIGGGFIGLEVAASARLNGCAVTLVESSSRLLARGMPAKLGDWLREVHERNGCHIHVAVSGVSLERDGERIGVRWGGGSTVVDVVVAGIGAVPNVELAVDAGLRVNDGIVVDRQCQTSDPDIFAAGDVTSYPDFLTGAHSRSESWKVAVNQGIVAARNMVGQAAAFDEPPWLWSDQYDHNLQSLGYPDRAEKFVLKRNARSDSWALIGLAADCSFVGAVAVNYGSMISRLRRMVVEGKPIQPLLKGEEVISNLALDGPNRDALRETKDEAHAEI